jgi:hypothetical protein
MSDITVINDSEQSSLVTNGLAKNGELYLKAAGSTDAGAIVVYDSGSWRTFANEAASFSNTYSVDFDGTNDYIDIGGSYDLGTFSAWFKPDNVLSASQGPYMIAGFTGVGISPYGFRAGILISGNVTGSLASEIITVYTGDWNYAYTSGSATISNTDWHHLAVHWTGSEYEIYLDGNQVKNAESQFGSGSKAKISITDLILGKRYDNNYHFPSLLDEVAIWSTPVSSIATLYNSGVPGDISSLNPNGHWRMGDDDSGAGTTITDQGSGGNDGTLTNGPTFSTDVPS